MYFLTTLVTLTTLLSAALSTPAVSRARQEYKYQTRIVNNQNDTGTFKGKLWLASYHTGAGLSDAVLLTNKTEGIKGYLNGTTEQFDLGNEYPWYMVMSGDDNYAEWEAVEINTSGGADGFSTNATGLQWNQADGFGGWLACDWFHGVPQLFWLYRYYTPVIPVSCSKIDLIPVPV